jgi:hypothetical protein
VSFVLINKIHIRIGYSVYGAKSTKKCNQNTKGAIHPKIIKNQKSEHI